MLFRSNSKIHILVIEDEQAIREGLVDVLVYHQYQADSAATGPEGLEKALTGKYDLILLDIMLPGMDGYEICNRIRAQDRQQAIIMLTAKTSDEEIVQGLKLGADDYVAKPFSPRELMARVEAVLRRSKTQPEKQGKWKLISGGEIRINDEEHRVIVRDTEIKLTPNEFDLLVTFTDHPGRVFTREELVSLILEHDYEGYNRTIDTHIKTVRKKIEKIPAKPVYIITVHGIGYKFSGDSYAALP